MEAGGGADGGGGEGPTVETIRVFGRQWPRRTFPKMIVFDVDYTLWPYWVDTHTRPPYTKDGDGTVRDGSGDAIRLYAETAQVLTDLRAVSGLQIAYASRTGQPSWLEQLAKLLPITPDTTMCVPLPLPLPLRLTRRSRRWALPDYREIYPGSKLKHFKRLSAQSGIGCDEMLFYDDEPYSK